MDTLKSARETGLIVEQYLREYCATALSKQGSVWRACDRSLTDIGLRIRPFLLRISCQEGGIAFGSITPVAAGVELVQLSTLIIDDILDESPLRNNKPSVFSDHGAKASISIGTTMSSLGFRLIAEGLERNHGLQNNVAVLGLFSQTHADIYVGQFLDLLFEGDTSVSEDQYIDMISKTTACFIQASLVAGAMLWDASSEIIQTLQRAGLFLGVAYQIRDDVIDVIGDPEYTGKPLGGDIQSRKMRLPLIRALQELRGSKQQKLVEILQRSNPSCEDIAAVVGLIEESDSIDYCVSKTKTYCKQATDAIYMLPDDLVSLKTQFNVVANWISSFEEQA